MKEIGIAEFKAHLSRYLRAARQGETIAITDRGTLVAELVRPRRNGHPPTVATASLSSFRQLPPMHLGGQDVVEILLQLRRNDR